MKQAGKQLSVIAIVIDSIVIGSVIADDFADADLLTKQTLNYKNKKNKAMITSTSMILYLFLKSIPPNRC